MAREPHSVEEEDEENSKQSQFLHLNRKPCCSKSTMYSHDMESKAFEMSSFVNKAMVS
jgi:hypothetical protein